MGRLVGFGACITLACAGAAVAQEGSGHWLSGTILSVHGKSVIVQTRTGTATVDASPAIAAERASLLLQGEAITVHGELSADGRLIADTITRAKPWPNQWPVDR